MEPRLQEIAIKAARNLANWIDAMPKYNCRAKAITVQVPVKGKTRLIFKYTNTKEKLVAKKILFS